MTQNLQEDTGMSAGWLGRTAIVLLIGLISVAPASADGPSRKFEHLTDETFTSRRNQAQPENPAKQGRLQPPAGAGTVVKRLVSTGKISMLQPETA